MKATVGVAVLTGTCIWIGCKKATPVSQVDFLNSLATYDEFRYVRQGDRYSKPIVTRVRYLRFPAGSFDELDKSITGHLATLPRQSGYDRDHIFRWSKFGSISKDHWSVHLDESIGLGTNDRFVEVVETHLVPEGSGEIPNNFARGHLIPETTPVTITKGTAIPGESPADRAYVGF